MGTTLKYSGSAPAASATAVLFDSTVSFPMAQAMQAGNIKRVLLGEQPVDPGDTHVGQAAHWMAENRQRHGRFFRDGQVTRSGRDDQDGPCA